MGRLIVDPPEPIGSERLVVFVLPAPIPITEGELRAVEIMLGNGLKELLADASKRPLKHRSGR
jgi:hypothetical protein